jgi:hypothetical protein
MQELFASAACFSAGSANWRSRIHPPLAPPVKGGEFKGLSPFMERDSKTLSPGGRGQGEGEFLLEIAGALERMAVQAGSAFILSKRFLLPPAPHPGHPTLRYSKT